MFSFPRQGTCCSLRRVEDILERLTFSSMISAERFPSVVMTEPMLILSQCQPEIEREHRRGLNSATHRTLILILERRLVVVVIERMKTRPRILFPFNFLSHSFLLLDNCNMLFNLQHPLVGLLVSLVLIICTLHGVADARHHRLKSKHSAGHRRDHGKIRQHFG